MIKVTIEARIDDLPEDQIIPALRNRFLRPELIIDEIHIKGKSTTIKVKEGN